MGIVAPPMITPSNHMIIGLLRPESTKSDGPCTSVEVIPEIGYENNLHQDDANGILLILTIFKFWYV